MAVTDCITNGESVSYTHLRELLAAIDLEKDSAELKAELENATGQKRARTLQKHYVLCGIARIGILSDDINGEVNICLLYTSRCV